MTIFIIIGTYVIIYFVYVMQKYQYSIISNEK